MIAGTSPGAPGENHAVPAGKRWGATKKCYRYCGAKDIGYEGKMARGLWTTEGGRASIE
jgi:hypothetical protein